MKSCLFVNYSYPPISSPGAQRAARIVSRLTDFNWKPYVLTVRSGYSVRLGGLRDPLGDDCAQVQRIIDPMALPTGMRTFSKTNSHKRLSIYSIYEFLKFFSSLSPIVDRTALWSVRACFSWRFWEDKNIDVVHSSYPKLGNHLLGYFLSRKLKVPWIAEFRDPLSWQPSATGIVNLQKSILNRIESWIIKRANVTVVVASSARDYFVSMYPNATIVSIPNGADFNLDEVRQRMHLRAHNVQEKYVLVHAGSLYGGARRPEPLIEAVKLAAPRLSRPVELHFYGNDSAISAEAAKRLHAVEWIKEFGNVPFGVCQDAINAADINVALLHDDPVARVSIMSKYFDYIPSGAPILLFGSKDALLSKIVVEDGAGSSFEYNEIEEVAEWIVSTLEGSNNRLPNSEEICLKWSTEKMVASVVELLNKLVND